MDPDPTVNLKVEVFYSPKALDYVNFFGDNFSVYKNNLSDPDPRFFIMQHSSDQGPQNSKKGKCTWSFVTKQNMSFHAANNESFPL